MSARRGGIIIKTLAIAKPPAHDMPAAKKSELTLTAPDDWHLHVRDGAIMRAVLPFTTRVFRRAIIMPNLPRPVTDVARCAAYRERILAAATDRFEPLMTLYLTERTQPSDVAEAAACDFVHAVKLYPKNATTHSGEGVSDVAKISGVLEAMQRHDVPLLIHGESTDEGVDVFDREKIFIERTLTPLRKDFPALRIVLEHVTTSDAVDYVREAGALTGATITPHHLLYSRNALFDGGLRPHRYCLPLPQREPHRQALVAAACSGDAGFFLGTDSAPHAKSDKESACGCAGVFNAPAAIGMYATIFDQAGALDRLERFASLNGARFYRLPVNRRRITLVREAEAVPRRVGDVVPLLAGREVAWRLRA